MSTTTLVTPCDLWLVLQVPKTEDEKILSLGVRSCARPSYLPTSRTWSLKSSRNGSISLRPCPSAIRLGRPPTLWWVLMVALGPLKEILSITSGHNVPCKNHSILLALAERVEASSIVLNSSSETPINLRPINPRFCSGSSIPFRPFRNCCEICNCQVDS